MTPQARFLLYSLQRIGSGAFLRSAGALLGVLTLVGVLPNRFQRQDYGIALPPGSPWREPLNREIPRMIQSPEWGLLVAGYLGPEA